MDLSDLRERRSDGPLTVGELNGYIKSVLDSDRLLSAVSVSGEISNFVYHRSGHIYFSLKDDEGQIKAVMFKGRAATLRFMPENGMRVIARGSVSIYTKDGGCQLYVNSMQPDGIGALYLAYERLKERLYNEGLFDAIHKRSIPKYPRRVGVITSPTGAAVRDIINVIGRRYPVSEVILYPAVVQGDGAVPTLLEALDYFDRSKLCDVIIIGRGGGSIEDLWSFNDEQLARKIFAVTVPVISAVGHETDFTICDFVADLRAPTPSAAAELAVPDINEVLLRVDSVEDRCVSALLRVVERMRQRLDSLADRYLLSEPDLLFDGHKDRLSALSERLYDSYTSGISDRHNQICLLSGRLDALSPLSVLSRGYSFLSKENRGVKSKNELSVGDELLIRLVDGSATATVNKISE